MAKELPYFKFYLNDWLTGNITIQDMATQGVFVNVCVLFWSRDCDLTYQNCLERFKKKDRKLIEKLVKTGIIKVENEKISIVFLEKQLENQNILSKTNQKNVKKRYSTPANPTNFSTTVEAPVYNIDEIRGDDIEIKEIRGDEIIFKKTENLIECFFKDLENSSELERMAMDLKTTKQTLISLIIPFKTKANTYYKNFNDFCDHFKKWAAIELGINKSNYYGNKNSKNNQGIGATFKPGGAGTF